ncbi:MAG: RlpA-like double-psi beta-barrel domain-containing protein [Acidimicrobiia bacterium]
MAAAVVTMVALPLLIKENRRSHTSAGPSVAALAPGGGLDAGQQISGATGSTAPSTTVATAPGNSVPATTPAKTGAKPATVAPATTAPAPVSVSGVTASGQHYEDGYATFHNYDDNAFGDHTCFHRTLPLDTRVTVTNTDSGASTWCIVRGRGPAAANRIIDLDSEVFAELADLKVGSVPVRLTW